MAHYTILLIDYEPRSIERFRDPLTAAGYSVEIATDGVSGIEAFHRLSPDMVLVEAMIPKKHGFEVCQELKRTPHGRRTPVIITTGVYKGRKYRTQALHIYGCDEYIEKPIAPERLLEIVGRFFGSGSSDPKTQSTESEPTASETGGSHSAHGTDDPIATPRRIAKSRASGAKRTKPTSAPPAVATDDTEVEIMNRLDEILPGGGRTTPRLAETRKLAVATAVEENPLAQMRAELDAELGSISGPLAFEMTSNVVPMPELYPSDQVVSPSVLEALPAPDAKVPVSPVHTAIPVAEDEHPGQIVNFDTTRPRKSRKAEQPSKGSSQQVSQVLSATKTAGPLVIDPPSVVSKVRVPRGTIIESELEPAARSRGRGFGVWSAVGVVAIVAAYLLFPRGDSNDSEVVPLPRPTPGAVASAPPVASDHPAESVAPVADPPSESVPQIPEPSPTVHDGAKPVLDAVKAPVSKKSSDRNSTTTPASTAVGPRMAANPAPTPPKNPKKDTRPSAIETASVSRQVAPAPLVVDAGGAGVETVPDPATAASTTTIAPGTLIPIDVADTMPVALSHQAPLYSIRARQLRIAGTVIMNVLINDRGTIDQVVLVTGVSGGDVNDAAIRAAKSWTYRPATKNGIPVKVWKSEQVVFKP